ncbi:MAG: siderophore-interacting protein [Acidimicrobiales bacterium]
MPAIRARREPPPFRSVTVDAVQRRSPHLVRLTLAGPDLEGLDPGLPAASVRLLVPTAEHPEAVPVWNGNEFRHADGTRPAIRTLTPVRFDADALELDVEVVLHGAGPLSSWAADVEPGARAAVSGTGRGYEIDPADRSFLLAGDESAIPAISVLLEAVPDAATVTVLVEARADARVELPAHPGTSVAWIAPAATEPSGSALGAAVAASELAGHTRVWVAGEAAAVQRIRKHLFDERGHPRSQCTVRGYWKHGRGQDDSPDD